METPSELKIASRMGAITSVYSCVQFVVADCFSDIVRALGHFTCFNGFRAHLRPTENENPGDFAR